mgnify:CR=1 FL=1
MTLGFNTLAIHAGAEPDPATGARQVPIYQTTAYVFRDADHAAKLFNLQEVGYIYSRLTNPTVAALANRVAALEGGAGAVCCSSGHAAQIMALFPLMQPGTNVVASTKLYGGTIQQFNNTIRKFGWSAKLVDFDDPKAIAAAIDDNTRALFCETICNPGGAVSDLDAIARVANQHGLPLIVDNTTATPFLCRPIEHGATLVVHSATKYLNGHSDIVGGMVVVKDAALAEQMTFLQNAIGGVQGPFDSFLALRGLKTLHLRMKAHCENAQFIAEKLEAHPAVEKVAYPGLASHPQHALAKTQMYGFGGMVSVWLKGGFPEAKRFMERLELFTCAESLGGVESLANHPAVMTHASIPEDRRNALGVTGNLVRLSVGVEDAMDLWSDIQQALSA